MIHPVDTGSVSHTLRIARNEDTPFLSALFFERNAPRFASLGWDDLQLRSILQMQYRARAKGYAEQFADLKDFVILDSKQQPIGELLLHEAAGEIRIVDVCISSSKQGRGVATRLLRELQQEAIVKEATITLRVDHENPARRLYQRLGFQKITGDALQIEMQWIAADNKLANKG